jgi:hypothetical protein
MITISLCVWAAVHLNIPAYKKHGWQFWRRFGWLIVGLFAPEVVAYIAWRQRIKCRTLTDQMRRALKESQYTGRYQQMFCNVRQMFRLVFKLPSLQVKDPEARLPNSPYLHVIISS